jgi:hypothetical protein
MKTGSYAFSYIVIICLVMIFLYSFTHYLGVLDRAYFQQHESGLTTIESIVYPDGSVGTNYEYIDTPYHYLYQFSALMSLIIPIVVLFILSSTYFRIKIDKKNYFLTLIMPFAYGVTNILYYLIVTDKSLGWEYSLGLSLVLVESIFIFVLVALVNGIVLFKKFKQLRNESS